MGNMVVVAVRHSDLDAVRKLDFDTTSHMMHDFETVCPKFFDGRHAQNNHMMLEEAYKGNVLFSGYYHASDNANLVVNNQLISYLPSGIGFYTEVRDMKEEANIADSLLRKMIPSIRDSISFENRDKKVSIRKSTKKMEIQESGDSYSLFGILTDCMHDINKETAFTTMADAVKDMPWFEDNLFIYNTNSNAIGSTPIVPLGNYRANQLALVSLAGNVFSVLALPNYGMDIDGINQKIEADKESDRRYIKIDSYAEVMKGFGYKVTLTDKKNVLDKK